MKKSLPLFFFLLLTISAFAQEFTDWKWLHEQPQGNSLRWIKMWDADNWYAAGYSGTFMKTTDAGATWWFHHRAGVPRTDGSTSYIYDAHFFDQNTGVVVGTAGIMRTTNGGLTFDTVSGIPSGATCYQVYFLNNSIGYVAGTSTVRIAKTTDAGLTWTLNTAIASATYYDVWTPNDTLIVASTTVGNIRRSTDGGLTWSTILTGGSATLYKLEFIDAAKGWLTGSSSAARFTTDAGATWTTPANAGLPTGLTFYDIDIIPPSPKFESFEDTLFPPDDWQRINVLGTKEWVRDTYYAYDGVASAYMDYETSGGEDWLITPKTPLLGVSDSVIFFVRKQYTTAYPPDSLIIMVSTTDSSIASFSPILYIDVATLPNSTWNGFSIPLSAYAGQEIFIAFKHKDTDGNGMWLDAVELKSGDPGILLTGAPQYLYYTSDNGATWVPEDFLSPTQRWTSTYYAFDLFGDKFVAVGAFGLINSRFKNNDPVCHTYFQKAGILYDIWSDGQKIITVGAPGVTGSTFDQILISTDNGVTWDMPVIGKQVPNTQHPVFVPPQEDNEIVETKDADLTPNSTSTLRSIEMISQTTGFAVGSNGAVYKTTNTGLNWDSLTTPILSTAVLYKVDFVSPSIGWIFNNTSDAGGTIWKTTDGGATWAQQVLTGQTGSNTKIYGASMVNENYGWCVNYTPRPFKTTDGGATWVLQPLSDAYGGFLYGISMVDTSLGYCVGGSGRVYKTTDGGTMWNVMTTPMGTTGTNYDVDFYDANYGFVVSSAGVVLITSDGGTTWLVENTAGSVTNYAGFLLHSITDLDTTAVYVAGSNAAIFKNSFFIIPVELTSFSAAVSGTDITLNWSTATETNNFGFEIQRASGESDWQKIGFVNGRGTTTEVSAYTFTDMKLKEGKYSYRLKQIDFDGTYKYYGLSTFVEISIPLEFVLSQNYPNPFNPVTTIQYSLPFTSDVTLKVYDILGTEVAVLVNSKKEAGRYEVQFDGTKYSSGVYFYEMKANDFTSVKKLILIK